MKSSPRHYSQRTFASVLFLGGLVALSFVPAHWRAAETGVASAIVVLVSIIWGLAVWALFSRQMRSGPLMLATTLCNFCCVLVLVQLKEIGVFWFYPLLMAVAFIMPWRWSIPLNSASVVLCLLYAAAWMPETLFLRLVATLLIALVFAALFSYNLNKHQTMLHDLAIHDPLTGAHNRRYFERKSDELRRHWKRSGRTASMIILDIDHFKRINDQHGHAMGDAILVALTRHISNQLRPMDRFCRLGGEEFAILLPDTPATQGVKLAERIRAGIAAGSLENGLPTITISCGVADYPEPDSTSEWPEQCDTALYAAKSAGRNRVVLAEPHKDSATAPA